jgi:glycosyltransferase involved in cell wall biosynthesis
VKATIRDLEFQDFIKAAAFLNQRRYHTVLVQFEYGMLYGDALVCAMRSLRAPVLLLTQHTVKKTMWEWEHGLLREVSFVADRVIAMTESMRADMNTFHAIPSNRLVVIPHGIPDEVATQSLSSSRVYQNISSDTVVIISNGLIHKYKGIEYVIRAIPSIVRRFPNIVYYVIGIPHPGGGGDTIGYYNNLVTEAEDLKVTPYVRFVKEYFNTDELIQILQGCDIYVNAYTDRIQAVSGTLAMAMGAGAVVLSTPYPHAVELLRGGAGIFLPFEDSEAIAEAVNQLLEEPEKLKAVSF